METQQHSPQISLYLHFLNQNSTLYCASTTLALPRRVTQLQSMRNIVPGRRLKSKQKLPVIFWFLREDFWWKISFIVIKRHYEDNYLQYALSNIWCVKDEPWQKKHKENFARLWPVTVRSGCFFQMRMLQKAENYKKPCENQTVRKACSFQSIRISGGGSSLRLGAQYIK